MLSSELIAHLRSLFKIVHQKVTGPAPSDWNVGTRNAKGDIVKWFDIVADNVVCDYLETDFPESVNLLSEEGEPRQFGKGTPKYTFILDPVDGSENFLRGLSPAGCAIAVLPYNEPITINKVQAVFMGNLFTQDEWWAVRGEGAFFNNNHIKPHLTTTNFDEILISCDFNHYILEPKVAGLLAQFRAIRCLGSAVLALATVAKGICGVHIDPRGTLTPENFIAPSLLITETGGVITDAIGNPLPEIHSLTDRFSILAATTPSLHSKALKALL